MEPNDLMPMMPTRCKSYPDCRRQQILHGIPACDLFARGIRAVGAIGEGDRASQAGCSREWPAWAAIVGNWTTAHEERMPRNSLAWTPGFRDQAATSIASHLAGKSVTHRDARGIEVEGTITDIQIWDFNLGAHEQTDAVLVVSFEASGTVISEFCNAEWEAQEAKLVCSITGTFHFTFPGASTNDHHGCAFDSSAWGDFSVHKLVCQVSDSPCAACR